MSSTLHVDVLDPMGGSLSENTKRALSRLTMIISCHMFVMTLRSSHYVGKSRHPALIIQLNWMGGTVEQTFALQVNVICSIITFH